MPALAPGTLFSGRFEIEAQAGQGGMGAVYRAFDHLAGGLVALKLLHDDVYDTERFEREAQLLYELRHPGIVAHVAHGRTAAGQRYLAMEWLDGHELADRLDGGPLGVAEALLLARRVADALGHAHRQGVIHRDLKPANLFLPDRDLGRVKVLDFGVARRVHAPRALTRTGMVIGTPEYMAPEQARGLREITPAADVFALGCVLYHCLAGAPPFVAESLAEVLMRLLFQDPPPLREARSGVPAGVVALLDRMLAKDQARRPADAGAVALALAGLAG